MTQLCELQVAPAHGWDQTATSPHICKLPDFRQVLWLFWARHMPYPWGEKWGAQGILGTDSQEMTVSIRSL